MLDSCFEKSLKYNYIYLNPCDNGLELFDGVQNHIAYYNQKKHQTIKKLPMKHTRNQSLEKQHKAMNV